MSTGPADTRPAGQDAGARKGEARHAPAARLGHGRAAGARHRRVIAWAALWTIVTAVLWLIERAA